MPIDERAASRSIEDVAGPLTGPSPAVNHARRRVAIVHEWFTTYAGSEKVLAAMLDEFPEADLFCLIDFLTSEDRLKIGGRYPRTSFLQHLPMMRRFYPYYLGLMPLAIEQFDLSSYDIIISNSHAVAKGVVTGPDQLHICYCYTPMRYAWDLQSQYMIEANMAWGIRSLFARMTFHYARMWDCRTSDSVDHFVACSHYISRRIRRVYRRESHVIYPNVAVEDFVPTNKRGDFYLASSRLTPYKKVHLIAEAFSRMPDRKLVIIGDGPQFKRIQSMKTDNITLLGYQPFSVLLEHMQTAKAFVFAAEEDFGIAPLEAQACGTPVLAFGRGGAKETVIDGVTGLHFHEQSASAICGVVERFERVKSCFHPKKIRAHAERFSTQRFRQEFKTFVEVAWRRHIDHLSTDESIEKCSHSRISPRAISHQDAL